MRIFISYSRQDWSRVQGLQADVEELGHEVWLDRELTGGQGWWDEILRRIRESDAFVFAISPRSLDSPACDREWRYASALGKGLLPVLVDSGVAAELLPPQLAAIQYLDYREQGKQAALRLGRAIDRLPPPRPMPQPLPVPPPVPLSYLGGLRESILSPGPLSFAEQSALVLKLRHAMRDDARPDEIRALARRFLTRDDVLARVAEELQALLQARAPDTGGVGVAAQAPASSPPGSAVSAVPSAQLPPARVTSGEESEASVPPVPAPGDPTLSAGGAAARPAGGAQRPQPAAYARAAAFGLLGLVAVVGLVVTLQRGCDAAGPDSTAAGPAASVTEQASLPASVSSAPDPASARPPRPEAPTMSPERRLQIVQAVDQAIGRGGGADAAPRDTDEALESALNRLLRTAQGGNADARGLLERLAQQGVATAQFDLGLLLYQPEPAARLERDVSTAFGWWKQASALGHGRASMAVANLLDQGEPGVVSANPSAALRHYELALAQGWVNPTSQTRLARALIRSRNAAECGRIRGLLAAASEASFAEATQVLADDAGLKSLCGSG